MTGSSCQENGNMGVTLGEEGCGTEETLRSPIYAAPDINSEAQRAVKKNTVSVGVDLFSQAAKTLSERCPFENEDVSSSAFSTATLPSKLASLLKPQDHRKRHKKGHGGTEKKSSRSGERLRGGANFWNDKEEYFRDLTLADINSLQNVSSFSSMASRKCFLIPIFGTKEVAKVPSDDGIVKEEASKDLATDSSAAKSSVKEDTEECSVSDSCSSLEWLLGCRNRNLLTSERPTKKRKLIGGNAGLGKVLLGCPCHGNSSLCDFCCTEDTRNELNQLIVCSSCKVAVHRKCYGVTEKINGSWLCSWCKREGSCRALFGTCVLCPKQGGALKSVDKGVKDDKDGEFAHLYCSLWIHEVFVENLTTMEPIMRVGEIKESRKKSVCSVCKVKHGVCIRCSNGSCRTSFHPLCAREARQRMEVWGRHGYDNVELRAFCSKHSDQVDRGSDASLPSVLPPMMTNKPDIFQYSNRHRDKRLVHQETSHTNSHDSGDGELLEAVSSDTRSNADSVSECVNGHQSKDMDNLFTIDGRQIPNLALVLKKLINGGKVNVKDVAAEINIPPDSLISKLADDSLVPELCSKIVKWLRNHVTKGILERNLNLDFKVEEKISEAQKNPSKQIAPDVSEKNSSISNGVEDSPASPSSRSEAIFVEPLNNDNIHAKKLDDTVTQSLNVLVSDEKGSIVCSNQNAVALDFIKLGASTNSYLHPQIRNMLQNHCELFLMNTNCEDLKQGEISRIEASSDASTCCNHQNQCLECCYSIGKLDRTNAEQLIEAEKLGLLELSARDEVEGEIIHFQHRLLANAVGRKHFTDGLISKVSESISREIDVAHSRKWDAALVNQYLCDLRDAKKQDRKEKRHKEAQAVLAAATAVAAASTRTSSFRKDGFDESASTENLMKLNNFSGRLDISSPLMPRPKETLSRVSLPKSSSGKYSDYVQLVSDVSKEHPRSCDICRRPETILNPIIMCSSCKVAVHLGCYCSVQEEPTVPWYCELCETLLASRGPGASTVNFPDIPSIVPECGLCGCTGGAFRKSSDSQWVHAFCAEWIFEPTFKRGQVKPVEGMDVVIRGADVCCICHSLHGVCVKCNSGQCQIKFHPSCARTGSLYINIKTSGGKLQHKAYCEKHSLEQKTKGEIQNNGLDELKKVKQIRVELERLRLLCERIIKREKIKRELVLNSHDILAKKRDHVARSVLVRSPFFLQDSSESATTSLKGGRSGGGCKSSSDAIQRSDDITVDSMLSVKHKRSIKGPVSLDTDQMTDDTVSSQIVRIRKATKMLPFSGKKISGPAAVSHNNISLDDGEWSSKSKKRVESFEKEMVMTSDQACMKNQKLPKGYVYIPVDRLTVDKPTIKDDCTPIISGEPVKDDG